ncbi:methyl-accepting chemotaxis protein [Pleomorphomonas diazotrophica]|uniref:Methyl-accepting chemotaxis protein n=1 Tax=Pleomorphomonas diazotrophica TaxID=1166257 RepID=A0A1I4SEQ8_9HYPH|nr:methyl-accepting chemotaxis protein [Pleomorphomonas diazotrophica]PKR88894.1 methyl-accepting chemotaxis protein [Pleomorphomonas diazotrophica]SFM62773.1 Methyl-accepting chemotaxis protein [Pleomorphomonas diazotrophica]
MTNSSSRFEAFAPGLAVILLLAGAAGAVMADMPTVALCLIAAAAAGTAVVLVLALRLSAAVRRSIQVARALGEGDFEVRDLAFDQWGQAGELTEAINDMADHIDAFVREASAAMEAVRLNRYYRRILPNGMKGALLRASTTINEATDVIQERVEAFEISTDEFGATINSIVESLVDASRDMGGAATRLGEGASSTDQRASDAASSSSMASGDVQRVAQAAAQLTGSAREVGREVERSAAIAREAVSRADETQRIVAGLSEAAEKIGAVIGMIEQVAGQTNLLALNATIEAARAGEAGKGFAVVAQEVKALASQTAAATGEITRHISEVQAATRAAVGSIAGIGGTIAEINAITADMRGSIEAQIAATTEIAQGVGNASEGTRQVSDRIAGITGIARETSALAQGLFSTSGALSAEGDRLAVTVREFLVRLRRGPLDRRQAAERVPGGHAVTIASARGSFQATCVDISMTGGRFGGQLPDLRIGDDVHITGEADIDVPATIRWIRDGNIGVEFRQAEMTPAASNRLRRLVSKGRAMTAAA